MIKQLCSFFLVLLLLVPSLHAQQPDRPFESEITAYEQQDANQMPPQNGLLFVGSSSIRKWTTLQDDFSDYPVYNRGFGGSQFSDLLYYMDRIVLPYKPKQIFVYEGDNDVYAGVSVSEVFNQFKEFNRRVWARYPETDIVFISIKPSPSRKNVFNKMLKANMLIKSHALLTDHLQYVDVFTPMLNTDGSIRSTIFVDDDLHMNDAGYDIWEAAIRPYLQ